MPGVAVHTVTRFTPCHEQEGSITKVIFYYAEGHHTRLTLSIPNCGPKPISPRLLTCVMYLRLVQSLTEVSGSRVKILGETLQGRADQGGVSPDVQSRALLLVLAYILSSGHHVVLGLSGYLE